MLGAVVIGGYFLLKNPNILGGLGGGLGSGGTLDPIPPTTTTPPPPTTPPTPTTPREGTLTAAEKAILKSKWGVTVDECARVSHPTSMVKASKGRCVTGPGGLAGVVMKYSDGTTCILGCKFFNDPTRFSAADKKKMGVANCKCNAGGNKAIAQALLGTSSSASYARVYVTYAHGFPRYTPIRL